MVELIEAAWLAEHGEDPDLLTVDARPRVKYLQGHLPRAVNLPLSNFFDGNTLALVSDGAIAKILGDASIKIESTVVLYDSHDGQGAAMLAWLLEYLGQHKVAILASYFEAWAKQGGEVLYRPVRAEPTRFQSRTNPKARASWKDLLDTGEKLLDLRSEDEFNGKVRTESRSGHVPRSQSLPWSKLLGGELQFLKPRQQLEEIVTNAGLALSDQIIVYCTNGPRAAIGYVALQQLGFGNVRLYDRSFHEWARKPELPLEVETERSPIGSQPVQASSSPCVVDNSFGLTP